MSSTTKLTEDRVVDDFSHVYGGSDVDYTIVIQ